MGCITTLFIWYKRTTNILCPWQSAYHLHNLPHINILGHIILLSTYQSVSLKAAEISEQTLQGVQRSVQKTGFT